MCFVLYMASDLERPLVPWEETSPAFYVSNSDDDIEKVRGRFGKKFVYYIGSDNGCGCGFKRDPEGEFSQLEPEERQSKRENHRRLFEYVADCLRSEKEIELFGCWSGDEELPGEGCRTVIVDDLADRTFWFKEREKVVVKLLELISVTCA